jgi:hypothetical protein
MRVIELIDHPYVLNALADQARAPGGKLPSNAPNGR